MKLKLFIRCLGLCAFVGFNLIFSVSGLRGEDFDATTETVGRDTNGLVTPANQLVTPAGTQVELPGIRPNALALSPDGKILVTAGLTHELIVVDPATGKILQRVALPSGRSAGTDADGHGNSRTRTKRRS